MGMIISDVLIVSMASPYSLVWVSLLIIISVKPGVNHVNLSIVTFALAIPPALASVAPGFWIRNGIVTFFPFWNVPSHSPLQPIL